VGTVTTARRDFEVLGDADTTGSNGQFQHRSRDVVNGAGAQGLRDAAGLMKQFAHDFKLHMQCKGD